LEAERDRELRAQRKLLTTRHVRAPPGSSLQRAAYPGQSMSWEPVPPSKIFSLRGKQYLKDRKKQPSPPPLYEPFAADLLRANDAFFDLPRFVALPPKTDQEERLPSWLPRFVVQNMFFPGTPPPLLGVPVVRAPHQKGYMVVCYWRISPDTLNRVLSAEEDHVEQTSHRRRENDGENDDDDDGDGDDSNATLPPHLLLWKRYASEAARAPVLNGCLKGVASVANLEDRDLGLPSLVRRYNGKPVLMAATALVGERQGVVKITRREDYLEFGLDVGTDFAVVSNQALHQMKPTFPKLVLDLGWLVEGRSVDDLPEGLVASMRINKVDLTQATDLDDWLRTGAETPTLPRRRTRGAPTPASAMSQASASR